MRHLLLLSALAFFDVVAAKERVVHVELVNDCKLDKVNEPVAIKLADITRQTGKPWRTVVRKDGKVVPCQLDDMDGDFVPDELFFLTDIKSQEKQVFEISLCDEQAEYRDQMRYKDGDDLYVALQLRDMSGRHPDVTKVEAPGTTNIFNDIYMHGITLESEMVGYRIYFDERQNIDLYGKCQRRIELPVTQFYTSSEQLANGYGVDVLWAGKSIGCGSFKRYDGVSPVNWSNVGVRGQRIVTTGPLRTIVEVYDLHNTYDDGASGDKYYNVRQLYTLVKGHRDMRVDVSFDNAGGLQFCTGVQKVGVEAEDSVRRGHTPSGFVREDGVAASWGCDYPDMGKKQMWAPEAIGLSVYVPKRFVRKYYEDTLNYLLVVDGCDNGAFHYYVSFCADKEQAEGCHSSTEWFADIETWKEKVSIPLKTKIKK